MINCFLDPCTSLPWDVKHGKAGVLLEVMHSNRSSLTSIKKIGQHSCMVHFYFSLRFDVSLTNRLSEDAMASWIWFIFLPNIVSPCVLLRRKKKINHGSWSVFQKSQVYLAEVCIRLLSFPVFFTLLVLWKGTWPFKSSWVGPLKAGINENSFSVMSFKLSLYKLWE